MSSDGYYLAAVTDNNLVCIWRYAPPPQQQQQQPQQAYHTQAAPSVLGTIGQQAPTAVRLLASSSSVAASTALTTVSSDHMSTVAMDSVLTQADLSHIDLSNTHTFSA
ncbi:unnamed protein product [Echinostoma caproni]|uniref:WD_REPEATS_REGION domain-containing protein n=1 Tax=Echinostoma caproni TaxID=27848 RepID=A0A183B1N9_9TREM|nr:unnamed protein product [Echinostoma caproni]